MSLSWPDTDRNNFLIFKYWPHHTYKEELGTYEVASI